MKPKKNHYFCPECGRAKMRFETESKALNFIAYNGEEVRQDSGKTLTRAYYCNTCMCWHVTSSDRPAYRKASIVDRMENIQHRNTLLQIESLVRQAEALVQENELSQARDKCYQAISKAETCVNAVRNWHEWSSLANRLEVCVESCKKGQQETMTPEELRSMLIQKIESQIEEATALINSDEVEKALSLLTLTSGVAARLKTECNDRLLRNVYRSQIRSLRKVANHKNKTEEEIKEQQLLNHFDALQKVTERMTDETKYKHVVSIKTKIVKVIGKLEELGKLIPQKDEILSILNTHILHSGISRVKTLLQQFQDLISQGQKMSARYYFNMSVEVLTTISDIEGEQMAKMDLLQDLENAQYQLNSAA